MDSQPGINSHFEFKLITYYEKLAQDLQRETLLFSIATWSIVP